MELTVSDDDIVIHMINQMYESDWFSEEIMMTWEEISDNHKSWARCQFFEAIYIAHKQYMDAKGQRQEQSNKNTEYKNNKRKLKTSSYRVKHSWKQ